MINVLGFGIMGRQICAVLQTLGYEISVWTRSDRPENVAAYRKTKKLVERIFARGPGAGSIVYTTELADLKPGLTIESLIEDLDVKRRVIKDLPYSVADHGLFTNTSSYEPEEVDPDAVGLHFFNPIHALKFAEVTQARSDLSDPALGLLSGLESLGFELIRTHGNRGYIGNFILFREIASALQLIDLYGYRTVEVDRVLSKMGHTVSLFDIIDLVGVDVVRTIMKNLRQEDASLYLSPQLDKALAANVLGKKNRTSIRGIIDA